MESFKSKETVFHTVISKAIEKIARGNATTTFIKEFIELLISTAGYKQKTILRNKYWKLISVDL